MGERRRDVIQYALEQYCDAYDHAKELEKDPNYLAKREHEQWMRDHAEEYEEYLKME